MRAYYRNGIKCQKQRTKTCLSTVEIIVSFPPWIRSYSSDILFCIGNMSDRKLSGTFALFKKSSQIKPCPLNDITPNKKINRLK